MQFYTYLYSDPTTNEPVYVGKGHGNRAVQHRWRSNNKRLDRLIKARRSEGYDMQPLIHNEVDEQTAHDMEVFWIAFFGRANKGTGTLFNATDGGEGFKGLVRTQEHNARIGQSNKGKKRSQEAKDKTSAAWVVRRKLNPPKYRDATKHRFNWDNKLARPVQTPDASFNSIVAVAQHYGIDKETVRKRLARGFPGWTYLEKPKNGCP